MIYMLPSAIASLIGIFALVFNNSALATICFLFLCGLCATMFIDLSGDDNE